MNPEFSVFFRVFIFAFVIAALSLVFTLPGNTLWIIASAAIAAAVVLIFVFALTEKAMSAKTGLPMEDELSRKANWKAGYYAFLTGLWLAIGIMAAQFVASEFLKMPEIEFRYAFEAIIVIPGIVFVVLASIFRKKGKLE